MHKSTPRIPLPLALGVAFCLATGCGSRDPGAVWEKTRSAFEAHDWAGTEAGLARLASLRAPTPEDWLLRAQLLMARERNPEAIEALANVPDTHPMGSTARLQAGQLELRLGRTRPAEEFFKRAIALNPREVKAHRELIYLYGMQTRWKELGREFRDLGEVAPLTVDDVALWCLSRNMTWDPEGLQADLERFLAADPADRYSRLALVENLRRRQYLAEAEAAVKALPDDDPEGRAARVKLALDRGEVSVAETLLDAGPLDNIELARLRGRLALFRRDGPAALEHFRRAYDLDPDHRDTLVGLGTALTLVGKADEAAPFVKKARDLDAIGSIIEKIAGTKRYDTPGLFQRLATAYENVGRLYEARAWYRLIIARDPLDAEAQRALFRIKARLDEAHPA